MSTSNASSLIDTPDALASILDSLIGSPTQPLLSTLTLKATYLIDVFVLRDQAFTTRGPKGYSLKSILESREIPKVFFDVRNDSDALFSHFNISLAGIQDLQLMELATRSAVKRHVNGLAKCIEIDAQLTPQEAVKFKECKEKGVQLFHPDRGGSYKVFNERPLAPEILQYCIQDVHYMPRLWAHYNIKMTPLWRQRMLDASIDRVQQSQSASYNGKGDHMALPPQGWQNL